MHLKLCTNELVHIFVPKKGANFCIFMRAENVQNCALTFLTLVGKCRCKGYSLFLSSTALIILFNEIAVNLISSFHELCMQTLSLRNGINF